MAARAHTGVRLQLRRLLSEIGEDSGCQGPAASRAAALLQEDPEAAKVPASAGLRDLPLHLATRNQAGLELVEVLLRAHPTAVEVQGFDDNLPLHYAAGYGRAEVVTAILRAYPEAVGVPNSHGNLPLHLACSSQANIEVVSHLLQAYPEAASRPGAGGNLAIHFAAAKQCGLDVVTALLQAHAHGASVANDDDYLPLHFAAEHGAELGVIAALVQACPEALSGANSEDEETPFELWEHSTCVPKHLGVAQQLIPHNADQDDIRDRIQALCEEAFDERLEARHAAHHETRDEALPAECAAQLALDMALEAAILESDAKAVDRADFVDACLHTVLHSPIVEQRCGWSRAEEDACRYCKAANAHNRRLPHADIATEAPHYATAGATSLRYLVEAYLFVQQHRQLRETARAGEDMVQISQLDPLLQNVLSCLDALVVILRSHDEGVVDVDKMHTAAEAAEQMRSKHRTSFADCQHLIHRAVDAVCEDAHVHHIDASLQLPDAVQRQVSARDELRKAMAAETRGVMHAMLQAIGAAPARRQPGHPTTSLASDTPVRLGSLLSDPPPLLSCSELEVAVVAPLEAKSDTLGCALEAALDAVREYNAQRVDSALGSRASPLQPTPIEQPNPSPSLQAQEGGEGSRGRGKEEAVRRDALIAYDEWKDAFVGEGTRKTLAAATDATMAGLKEFAVGAVVGAVLGEQHVQQPAATLKDVGAGSQESEEGSDASLFTAAAAAIARERHQQILQAQDPGGVLPSRVLLRAARMTLHGWQSSFSRMGSH